METILVLVTTNFLTKGLRSKWRILSFLYVFTVVNTIYLISFVETPRKFIIAKLSIALQ